MGLLSLASELWLTRTRHPSVCPSSLAIPNVEIVLDKYVTKQQIVRNVVILDKLTVAQITK
jgi:hypothetical protein